MYYIFAIIVFPVVIGLVFHLILHWIYRAPRIVEQATPEQFNLPYSQQYLTGPKGKRLFSWFIPANDSCCTLVVVHGWGANAEMMFKRAANLAPDDLNIYRQLGAVTAVNLVQNRKNTPRFAVALESLDR